MLSIAIAMRMLKIIGGTNSRELLQAYTAYVLYVYYTSMSNRIFIIIWALKFGLGPVGEVWLSIIVGVNCVWKYSCC